MTTLLSALFLSAALRGSLELSDRTEVRVTGTTVPGTTSAELMTNPTGLLTFGTRRWEITARYAPSLTLRGLGLDPSLDFLHRGHLEASIEATRRLRIIISGDGAYGTLRFLSPTLPEAELGGPIPTDTLPGTDTIHFASFRAGVSAIFRASRRLTLSGLAEYGLSGGVDEASQASYPLELGPRAALGAEYALTRRDTSRGTLDAAWVTFSSGSEAALLSVTESWSRRLTRRTTSTLGLGAALDAFRPSEGASRSMTLYPVAEATLAHKVPMKRLDLSLGVRVSPVIDRFLSEVDPRFLADASATWKPSRRFSLWAHAGGAQSLKVGEPDALTQIYGDAGVGVRVQSWVEIVSGARSAYQLRAETEPSQMQWMVFTGATLTAPRLRF